jgi:hypothetical protein
MPPKGFEPKIPASELPQTPALARVAIVIKSYEMYSLLSSSLYNFSRTPFFSAYS